jgi:hypothetical protein
MFEQDLLDEEVKKKKRRVLLVLFAFLLLGAAVAVPLTELLPPTAPTTVSEAAETPAPTGTRPTLTPAGTAMGAVTPVVEATATEPLEVTPQPTPTASGTPAVAEETPAGIGGGTPGVSLTGTVTPAGTAPAPATSTPSEPSQLPASGADASRGVGWLNLGLVAVLLGALMLASGHALRNAGAGRR